MIGERGLDPALEVVEIKLDKMLTVLAADLLYTRCHNGVARFTAWSMRHLRVLTGFFINLMNWEAICLVT
jgi:hypothetical protein